MRHLCYTLVIALAACSDSPPPAGDGPDPEAVAATVASGPADPAALPYFVLGSQARSRRPGWVPFPRDSAARRQRVERQRSIARAEMDLATRVGRAGDWRAADAILLDAFGPDSVVSVRSAVQMLDRFLLRGEQDADKAEALGRYTQVLLDYQSEEGALLLWALLRLEGHWEEGRRQRSARMAADRLGGAYARIAGCVDCTTEQALSAMWPATRRSKEDILRDIAAVHRELRQIELAGTPMPG
ncbi:MAG: hypothetical protein AAGK21_08735 [Bacteroidota bacterium]